MDFLPSAPASFTVSILGVSPGRPLSPVLQLGISIRIKWTTKAVGPCHFQLRKSAWVPAWVPAAPQSGLWSGVIQGAWGGFVCFPFRHLTAKPCQSTQLGKHGKRGPLRNTGDTQQPCPSDPPRTGVPAPGTSSKQARLSHPEESATRDDPWHWTPLRQICPLGEPRSKAVPGLGSHTCSAAHQPAHVAPLAELEPR